MPNPATVHHILKQLDLLRREVEALASDAELGRRVREISAATKTPANGAVRATAKKAPKTAKRNGHDKPASKSSKLDAQILELVQSEKAGIGARDLAAALKIKPGVASYRLSKLRDEKKLRSQGKTNKTVYLPVAVQA